MPRVPKVLCFYLLDDRSADLDHAALIVDRLSATRSVDGALPEWRAIYETDDVSEVMEMCAADLEKLDPHWVEIFDFRAVARAGAVRTAPR